MNNWGNVTSNKKGFQPLIINGRPVKSINQFYNKKKGKLQSELKDAKSSNRIKRLSTKINLKIDDYLHKTSRYSNPILFVAKILLLFRKQATGNS